MLLVSSRFPGLRLTRWSIYYADAVVSGDAPAEWHAAPAEGVQVVVLWETPTRFPWRGVTDRQLWTGTDEYDPFGFGVKRGSLIPDAEYQAIWDRAAYG